MVSWSKLPSELGDIPCTKLAHPWTENCLLAAIDVFITSCVGSAGFFSILYLCQYLSKILKHKKKKPSFKDLTRTMIRSILFSSSNATITTASSCFLRNLLGRYHYYLMVLIPGTLGGFSIFLETRPNKELFANTLGNCLVEYCIRELEANKIIKWNSNYQTIIFMVLASVMSTLMGRRNNDNHYIWFFTPPKVDEKSESKNGQSVCFHKEDCRKHNFYLFVKYFVNGLILQLARLFLRNIKNPWVFVSSILLPKNFKLAAFLGGYVVIYQSIRCFLYQKEGKYSSVHDAIAGFLAGATFRFQPTIPILNSAIINIIQILTEIGYSRNLLPNLPYTELVFLFTCGILYHTRILHSNRCPQVAKYILSAITNKTTDHVTNNCIENFGDFLKTN